MEEGTTSASSLASSWLASSLVDMSVDVVDTSSTTGSVAALSGGGLVAILVVGASLMGIVLLIVMVMIVKKCCPMHSRDALLQMDAEYGCCVTKSAPSTRQSSPYRVKKDINGPRGKKVLLMRSLTADMIPDFDLPAKRVQPVQPLVDTIKTPTSGKIDLGTVTCPPSPEPPCDTSGQVWFSLLYDDSIHELHVNLIKAKGLPPRISPHSSRNPYVKVYVLPDETQCYESKVKKKTLHPRFEEKYVFKISPSSLSECELRLSVYDLDQRRTRHSLGYILVPLADMDLSQELMLCKDLTSLTHNEP